MGKKKHNPVDNLIPTSERSKDEVREIGRKGGIASGQSRRRRREFRETLEILANMQIKDGVAANIENIRKAPELKNKNLTVLETIALTLVKNAQQGDHQSIKLLIEMLGEKPAEKLEVDATVKDEGKLGAILKQIEKGTKQTSEKS